MYGSELLGMSTEEIAKSFNLNVLDVERILSEARRKLTTSQIPQADLILQHLEEIRRDEYRDPASKEKLGQALSQESVKHWFDQLAEAIGEFQVAMQSVRVNDSQLASLQKSIEPDEIRNARDALRIDEISTWERYSSLRTRLMLTVLVVGLS